MPRRPLASSFCGRCPLVPLGEQAAAVDEGDDEEVEYQAQSGDRQQTLGEPQVRDAGMGADVNVLRVAGDGPGRADVRRCRQADQVRDGVESQPPCQVQYQRALASGTRCR